jgi:hypothetical protein
MNALLQLKTHPALKREAPGSANADPVSFSN